MRRYGNFALRTCGGGLEILRQDAVEDLLPEIGVPRVAHVIGGRERDHVVVESGNQIRLQVNGQRSFGHILEAFDEFVLSAPAVARHPDEMVPDVEPLGGRQHAPAGVSKIET